jgi:hypothetical protein
LPRSLISKFWMLGLVVNCLAGRHMR